MKYIRYAIWILVIIVGIIFTTMNARLVEIDYYFGGAKANLFLPFLILIILIIGVILGYLIAVPRIMKLRHENRRLVKLLQQPDHG